MIWRTPAMICAVLSTSPWQPEALISTYGRVQFSAGLLVGVVLGVPLLRALQSPLRSSAGHAAATCLVQ